MKWLGVIKMIAEVFLKKIKKCKYYYILFQVLYPIRTLAFIVALIALFKVINVLQKKKVSFSTRMTTGTVLGLVLGVIVQAVAKFPDSPKDIAWISELSGWYGFVGGGFIG